jgi:hypothetical protein
MGDVLRFNPNLYFRTPGDLEAYQAIWPTQETRKLTIYSTSPEAEPGNVERDRALLAMRYGRSRFIRETYLNEFDALTGTDKAFYPPPPLWVEVELLPNGVIRVEARYRGQQFWKDEEIRNDADVCNLLVEFDNRGGVNLIDLTCWASDTREEMKYMQEAMTRKKRKRG